MTTIPPPVGVIAHYNLLERLEPSGPGDLFRARDTKLGRTVSIRLLPSALAPDGASRRRLLETARSVIGLSHPNVTTLFEAGEHDGRIYLVFEFLKGQSLRAEMAGRSVNVRRAVDLAVQMADAVSDAHAAGYLHGGLSPETVVVTAKGNAKIPAFAFASSGGFEETDGQVRLRDYLSPEEAMGKPGDDRLDVYSVGAMLYEMLASRRPSPRGAAAPSVANPNVPTELDIVALKAVAPNPDRRFQSAAALAAELRAVAAILDVRGDADDDAPQETAFVHVGRAVTLAIAILAVLALIAWHFMH